MVPTSQRDIPFPMKRHSKLSDKRPTKSSKGFIYILKTGESIHFEDRRKYTFSKGNNLRKKEGREIFPYFQHGGLSLFFLICICPHIL